MQELEKILEEIENERESYEAVHVKSYEKGLRFAAEAIRKHMADDWIPVEERLPEEPKENPVFDDKSLELYLVDMGGSYPLRAFWNGKKFTDGWSALDVKAWMPLPEPYQPKRGSEGWNRPRRDK
mgnify:FL=1